MTKDTAKLLEELQNYEEFRDFYDENRDYLISGKLSDMLQQLIEKKGLRKSEVVRTCELSEVYAYQIFSGLRVPERKKLLCLALAMQLNIEETQQLLRCSGYSPLYVKLPFDSVVLYAVCNHLTVIQTNAMLFEYGLETLG